MANDNYNSSPFTPQYTLIQKIKELQNHVKTIYDNEEEFNQRIAELESKSIQFITLENVDLTADSSVEIDFSAADYGKAAGVKNCKLFIICSHGPAEYGARPVIFELSKFKHDLSLNEITFNGNVFSVSSDDKYADTISAVATLSLKKIRIKFARFNFTNLIINSLETDGDANIGGDLDVSGVITGNSIIENMNGYSFNKTGFAQGTIDFTYVGIVKNGNKITLSAAFEVTMTNTTGFGWIGFFNVPASIGEKLYPSFSNNLDVQNIDAWASAVSSATPKMRLTKESNTKLALQFFGANLTNGTKYYCRYEATFLLSENLAPSGV